MALDPNIILAAGRGSQTSDLAALLQQRNAIKLSALAVQREQQGRDALDRVKADPTDMTALSDLAAVNPQAAQGYLAVQSAQRAAAARGVAGKLVTAYAQPGMPGSAAPAPAAPRPGVNIDLPATGQSVQIPAEDRAADSPEASRAQSIQAVGQKAAETGDLDPAKAWGDLYSLDPDMGDKTLASIKGMDQLRVSRLAESHDALGKAAQSLLAVPDTPDHGQRIAAAMKILPQLAAHGVTQADVMGADLSDAGLHGIIGQGLTLQGAIEAAQKDRQFGLDTRKQNLEERKQTFEEHKPISAGFGTTLVDPTTHQPVFDGSGGGSAASIPAIAERITAVEGTGKNPNSSASGPGQMVDGTFVSTFRQAFPQQAGLTDAQILAKRGTGVEGQMTQVLVAQNASQLAQAGISPTPGNVYLAHFLGPNGAIAALKADPSTPVKNIVSAAAVKANPMLANMTAQQVQNWANQKMGGSGGAGGLAADTLTNAADYMIANGGKAPVGFSRNQAAQAALQNAFAARMKEKGLTMDDVIRGGQTTASQGNAFKAWNSGRPGTGAAVARTINVAIDHLDQTTQAAAALQNGNVPLFNRITNGWAKQTGAPAPTDFASVKDFVTDEVTKAILGNPGGVGDREKAAAILASWNSPAQTAGVIKRLQGLMAGQLHGLKQQYEVTTGRDDFGRYVSPRASSVLGSISTTTAAIPEGAKAMLKGNPALRDHFDEKYGAGAAASVLGG